VSSLAGASARPAYDVMLYGNVTGRPYGWASRGEVELMLTAAWPGPDSCPPATGGHRDDWYLVPAGDDWFYWQEWHQRRGLDEEWLRSGVPHPWTQEPEITFYTGTHRPSWLWSGTAPFPLCVSYSTLHKVKTLHRGLARWILDSRGFSELAEHGRWTIPAEQYAADVARYDEEIGGLQWAATQDWMCHPSVIGGGMLGRVRCAGTGLSVEEHLRRTVASFTELTGLWPRYSRRPCPFIPSLQGDSPAALLRCYQMYLDAGVELGSEHPLVTVGSVKWLQASGQLPAAARVLGQLGLHLHWFGVALDGLRRPEIQPDIASPYAQGGTQSLDSMTWSMTARHEPRMPGCTHAGRDGQPSHCNNCPRYAAAWRERLLAKMTAAQQDPARLQGALFTDLDLPAGSGLAG
jgi:hypothetical protein